MKYSKLLEKVLYSDVILLNDDVNISIQTESGHRYWDLDIITILSALGLSLLTTANWHSHQFIYINLTIW